MGDWREDRFLDDFLVTDQNRFDGGDDINAPSIDEKHSDDGLENCADLYNFSADDDTLVSYLSGEFVSNVSGTSKKGRSVQLGFESQVTGIKVTKSSSRPQDEPEELEVEDDTVDDYVDLRHPLALNQDDDLDVVHEDFMDTTVEERAKGSSNQLLNHYLQPSATVGLDTSQLTDPVSQTVGIEDGCNSVINTINQQERGFRIVTEHPDTKSKRGTCKSKSAIAARERRLKNKQHVTALEESVKKLSEENEHLKKQDGEKSHQIEQLREEIRYLKHVIANKSTISHFLENISMVNGHMLVSCLQSEAAEPDKICQTGNINIVHEKRKHFDSVLAGDDDNSETASALKRQCTPSDVLLSGSLHSRKTHLSDNLPLQDKILAQNSDTFENLSKMSAFPSLTTNKLLVNGSQQGASAEKMDGVGTKGSEVPLPVEVSSADLGGKSKDYIGGICIHVQGKSVSFELCAACNHNAMKSRGICP